MLPSVTALTWHAGDAGFESPREQHFFFCSPSPLEETINQDPYTYIHTTFALNVEELKDSDISPKVVPLYLMLRERQLQKRQPACMRIKFVKMQSQGIKVIAPY